MGYERNDRGYATRGAGYTGYDANRSDRYRGAGYDRNDPRDRGFFDRAGDEVRSWFGDEEAERRRRIDERYDERYDNGSRSRSASQATGGYRSPDSYPRWSRSNRDDRGGYAAGYAP